jgi:hypothetical protein
VGKAAAVLTLFVEEVLLVIAVAEKGGEVQPVLEQVLEVARLLGDMNTGCCLFIDSMGVTGSSGAVRRVNNCKVYSNA